MYFGCWLRFWTYLMLKFHSKLQIQDGRPKSLKIHKISVSWNKGKPNYHFGRLFGYVPLYSYKLETGKCLRVQNPRWPPPKSTKKILQNYVFDHLMHLCSIVSCKLYKKVNTYLIHQDSNWIRITRCLFHLRTLLDNIFF